MEENRSLGGKMSIQLAELSRLVGITKTTIRRWFRQEEIPIRVINGTIVFNKRQI